jgi:CRP-like cAMP-binding protein
MISIMSELDSLFAPAAGVLLAFPKGTYLFHQDDPVRVVYRLLDGAVQLRRQQAGGAWVVLQRAQAGTIRAEASLSLPITTIAMPWPSQRRAPRPCRWRPCERGWQPRRR